MARSISLFQSLFNSWESRLQLMNTVSDLRTSQPKCTLFSFDISPNTKLSFMTSQPSVIQGTRLEHWKFLALTKHVVSALESLSQSNGRLSLAHGCTNRLLVVVVKIFTRFERRGGPHPDRKEEKLPRQVVHTWALYSPVCSSIQVYNS